ncbi:hypothetical protein K440DRAFT_30933 [Wilcoxina mikolae CBS 423.85]|nr:hypothetical protein K440DRAFT_30933 [Wilcoxina mikolae CBS 423.85]
MRFSTVAAVFAFVASASASAYGYGNATQYTTTEIVHELTTYCPYATKITQGSKTYTVTEATTLTIKDCPCTLTHTYTSAPVAKTPVVVSPPPVYTTESTSTPCPSGTGVPTHYGNATTASAPTYAASSSTPKASTPAFEGSANRATVAGGALAGLLGVVAYLL